ncbi:hypothetical protein E4T38_08850 [Aureobasidium subglaciale]|nr:hypothetical protein E4T38_08850 [Aureobasidium subglaciale]KAI5214766.1 hypothetical protein E4T40_08807 [Aureobasidium subglaciale]KAI5217713.1 hypothetical protein E4T41_08717 [Aureobasidium subglaciale]KAI5255331.1 hypothetical protein E4T46_08751 [Aureobasidium subglaciale]
MSVIHRYKENLKRHLLLHRASNGSTKHPCFYCDRLFSRRDLRKRHIKKQHPQCDTDPDRGHDENVNAVSTSTSAEPIDLLSHIETHQKETECPGPNHDPVYPRTPSLSGDDLAHIDIAERDPTIPWTNNACLSPNKNPPSSSMSQAPTRTILAETLLPATIQRGVELFFIHVSPYLPFIHQHTFDTVNVPEALLMGMLSVSLQFESEQEKDSKMSALAFSRGRELLGQMNDSEEPLFAMNIHTVQAYILLEMHAAMYSGGLSTTIGLQMHHKSVELVRRYGLTEPLTVHSGRTEDLDALWRQFIRSESHKRTLYTVNQLDVYWYDTLSQPRLLSHLEIKHDLPCSEQVWSCSSSTAWAHQALTQRTSASPKYLTAIQECLSSSVTFDVSALEPYSALIVLLFLLSSARELSGWTTMTGRLCFERFDALNASLLAFEPLVDKFADDDPMAVLMKSTWHMVMIELLHWSHTHTNGVVEGSLDAAFAAATHLSMTQEISPSLEAIASLEPHINYFLSLLSCEHEVYNEAPWVTIFAFKAALIGWQLFSADCWKPADFIGAGDKWDMYQWMDTVFDRRKNWCVGRLVTNSLKELEAVS